MDLSLRIGKTTFDNPVTVASGTFGDPSKYGKTFQYKKCGALVPKTVTLHAQEGNPAPRIAETPSGMVNAIGIENGGVDFFIKEKLPALHKTGVPIIASVLGHGEKEFQALAHKLNQVKNLAAIELNLSCPNVGHKVLVSQDPKATAQIVRSFKKISRFPIIAKLSPNVTDIALIAKAAQDAGADAVSLVNTFSAMVLDVHTKKSKIGNVFGGLSGPAIRPMAVLRVYQTAQQVSIPIIGMGGIMTADDALEFILAGASMVAVGTASFIDPNAPVDVLKGIKAYMRREKITKLQSLVGLFKI